MGEAAGRILRVTEWGARLGWGLRKDLLRVLRGVLRDQESAPAGTGTEGTAFRHKKPQVRWQGVQPARSLRAALWCRGRGGRPGGRGSGYRMLARLAPEFGFHPEDETSLKDFERGGEGVRRFRFLFQNGPSGNAATGRR